ncbi:8034_t:CDS:1, partial [Funneliformis mosseae]
ILATLNSTKTKFDGAPDSLIGASVPLMYPNKIKQLNVKTYNPVTQSLMKKYGNSGINPDTKYDAPITNALCLF